MSQTWDLDSLTADQRELLGDNLCQTNEGAMFFDPGETYGAKMIEVARSLAKLGLVDVDEPADGHAAEVGVSLTDDGQAWLLSLPEGSLGAR